MTEQLTKDKKGAAVLQLHADRGMNAARELAASGQSVEAFLKANPKVEEAYRKDAAFREGFDAYLWAKGNLPKKDFDAVEASLNERDGWYSRHEVQFRA